MPEIGITENCICCGLCVMDCPAEIFQRSTAPDKINVGHTEDCIRCGHCVAICPADAVKHEAHPLSLCPVIEKNRIPCPEDLEHFLRVRRSGRGYESKPVSRSILERLVDAARFAPTATNREDVEITVITDPAKIDELGKATLAYYKRLARQLLNPFIRSLYTLVVGKRAIKELIDKKDMFYRLILEPADRGEEPVFKHPGALFLLAVDKIDMHGRDNACYAAYHIVLLAESLGLTTCLNGFITLAALRDKRIGKLAGLSPETRLESAVAVGYPSRTYKRLVNRNQPKVRWIEQ